MMALIEEIITWFGPVFQTAGYPIIATAVLLERSILLGLVVPGEVTLALGAIYASRGDLEIVPVILIGFFAALVGESTGFWLGRRYGESLIKRLPYGDRMSEKLSQVKEHFHDKGGWTVAIGRYATAAGAFVPFAAGAGRMPFRRFLAWDVPAIAVWAAGVGVLGFVLGEQIDLIERILSRFGWIMLGLLVVGLGARFFYKGVKSSKR
ncbi:MAG TPA: DedA family protein [Actinomycetota bacterium]|nr:DedA family protein [Actinomycetota bacterium]